MKFGNITIGKQLFVGWGKPKALGKGEEQIRGAAYVEGPLQIGKDDAFSEVKATVMIDPENNTDSEDHPFDSLQVEGHQTINNGNLHTSNLLACTGQACSFSGSTINVQGWKGFDIKHPNKEKHRLRHVCVEGPEAAVYTRGRVCNGKNVIDLPSYWRGLVDYETVTVQLTAVGSHQNVIVKRISPIEGKIYLQAQGGMPVDCFYHIMAARIDGEELVVEYEGESPADYPGDPSQFSISGYDYGRGVTNE